MSTWHPAAELLTHLDDAIPDILASQSPSGHFGSQPWISTDQNVLLALAAVCSLPQSRFHGSAEVLDAIGRGGLALADEQDANGMWEFRKKDGSEWGPIRMPWAYSRWMRAYYHVGERLPEDVRQRWEVGLKLGFSGIYDELEIVDTEQMSEAQVVIERKRVAASQAYRFVRIHNIPAHHAMALAFAGQVFDRPDWRERASVYLRAVAEAQSPHGWWAEHGGPVVAYNFVYVEALAIYQTLTGDDAVRPALEQAARYHAEFTYPDGSAVETVDGRNPYKGGVHIGNSGFALTAAGRGWLARQHRLFLQDGGVFDADYAANMLLYGGQGGATEAPAGDRETHAHRMGDMALTMRRQPWFACLSAIATDIPLGRFGCDRQNFLSVYHDDVGLIVGGGDTKLQPLWSSFTVGDTSLLAHTPGDEEPDFSRRGGLWHTPHAAQLDDGDETPSVRLCYGDNVECRIQLHVVDDGHMRIELSQTGGVDQVQAHLTMWPAPGTQLRTHAGRHGLDDAEICIDGTEEGWIEHNGWRLQLPAGSRCQWPALPHNPYRKDGHATSEEGRIVLSLALPEGEPRSVSLMIM